MIVGQSCPLWILGPKKDPFGNSYPGIESVAERAQYICGLPPEQCSHTSFHLLHEVKTEIKAYEHLNSPFAMEVDDLTEILEDSGKKVLAVTVPAFGFADLYRGGAILSEDRRVRMRTKDLIREGLDICVDLQSSGLGEGTDIWWPATDSLRYPYDESQLIDGRKRLIDFWAEMLGGEDEIWLEFKPGDPGDRDFFANTGEAIEFFVEAMNAKLGRSAAWVNPEFAHSSMIGDSVDRAMADLLKADAIKQIVHVNSSGMGMDMDKRVGAVNHDDTAAALKRLHESELEIIAEHDIKCTNGDPIGYYLESVKALQKMLQKD